MLCMDSNLSLTDFSVFQWLCLPVQNCKGCCAVKWILTADSVCHNYPEILWLNFSAKPDLTSYSELVTGIQPFLFVIFVCLAEINGRGSCWRYLWQNMEYSSQYFWVTFYFGIAMTSKRPSWNVFNPYSSCFTAKYGFILIEHDKWGRVSRN